MSIVDYTLAEAVYNTVKRQNDAVLTAKQIEKEVKEIEAKSKLTPKPLIEKEAFAKWLEDKGLLMIYQKEISDRITLKNIKNGEKMTNGVEVVNEEEMTLSELMNEKIAPDINYISLKDRDNIYFKIKSDAIVKKVTKQGKYGEFTVYEIPIIVTKAKLKGEIVKKPFDGVYGFKPRQVRDMQTHNFEGEFKLSRQGTGKDTRYILEHETDYNY